MRGSPRHIGDELLPQVEDFQYLKVLFMSRGRKEQDAVMQTLYGSVMVKRELMQKAELFGRSGHLSAWLEMPWFPLA